MNKLFRVTTVPISLKVLLKGQHRFMSQKGFEVIGISSKGQALCDVQKEEGIKIKELKMTRTISPFQDLKSLLNFYKLCKKEKPLIVHSHTPKAGIIGMLGAKLAGVPIRLHTVAGLPLMEAKGIKRKILDSVEKLTYACATAVYPNSKGLYDFILKNKYTSEDKLKVIANGSSNGVNTSFFSPQQVSEEQKNTLKKELNIQPDDFVFIFVGRLVGDKGINELTEAFSSLNIDNVKLLLVGPMEKELDPLKEKTLHEIEKNHSIISVGYQKDVRPFFAISDLLVFPSYREGFPNVVMQAGAMGLPSIVTNINGCNEIIIEGENGTIIPVKNVEELKKQMESLSTDKVRYNKLKENSRKMIANRYEQSVVWEALLEEYKKLTTLHNTE
ncbi:glycosyl transferase family 1 [Capnocytophaga stomatis]|uniref:glycosyltransferase family 4 protein n=1 Tax=Capnocytophaga stomatis TaxID=1848904 RepID=UPI001A55657E|nr:glycosyltransferase family 4 protein [Capnocytophaga stomatis]GIJ97702.1 glycosyl transferase family 1 [Capnocytophaga stomatis]